MLIADRHGQVVRPVPVMDIQAYRTYTYATPARTHFRWADCEEYQCVSFRFGFKTLCDLSDRIGRMRADFIRKDKTREFKENRTGIYTTEFIFPPGTRCWEWRDHKVPVDRPPILVVRGGDWRASTGLIRRHSRVEEWTEDFAEHQDGLNTVFQRG